MYCYAMIVAITVSSINISAFSQPTALNQYQISFEQIPTPNFGRVNAILRDDRGFMWFGTERGLQKFDGYQVRVFPGGDMRHIKQQVVMAVTKLGKDSLLLGTGKGLWVFDLNTEQMSPFSAGSVIAESWINTIIADTGSTIWIGTNAHGLFLLDFSTKEVRRYTNENGLTSNRILSLVRDRSGRLWIGTSGGGLNLLVPMTSQILHYRSNPTDPGTLYADNITSLCERDTGELWIGTSEGLNVLYPETGRMKRVDLHSRIKHSIMAIAQDPSSRMWIAVSDLGLMFYSNDVFTTFTTVSDVGRSLNLLRTLYPDPVASDGNTLLLWTGTREGINKILMSQNPFANHIRNLGSLHLDRGAVLSLCEDKQGVLWVGLWGGGLDGLKRSDGSFIHIVNFKNNPASSPAIPHNDVGSVMEDRSGKLWIGTAGGLAILDGRREQIAVYKHESEDPSSLAGNDVAAIYEDRSGTIWICTRGGLSEVLPGKPIRFRNFFNDPKEAHPVEGNFVSDFLQDRNSHHWASTYGRGLNRLESDGSFTRFIHPADTTRREENWIYSLVEDREGMFWLSTLVGLVSFDPASGLYTRHIIEQLHEAHIFGIYVDGNNDLWLSTQIGLAKYSPRKESFTRFDEKHGILFTELRSGFHKNSSGRLFVGGLDGFVEFDSDNVLRMTRPPEIEITSLSIFDKELPASTLTGNDIRLPHNRNFVSFSFAALDYTDPRQNRFMYRMVGVDEDWVDAGTRNYARYPNLNPGSYLFHVRGSNSDNVWNEAGTSIAIVIAPPYWQTWWFRILAALALIGTIYTVYRYRLRKVLDIERLRLRIANDLHDDVGSNLSTIAMVSRTAQRAPELNKSTRNKLAEIYDTAIQTSEGMRDLVWFIKPENDTLDDLFMRMKDVASSLLRDIHVAFHSLPVDSKTIPLGFKRNLFLSFKEVITNIAKHANATRVDVHIVLHDGRFEVVIEDDGKGFEVNGNTQGNGLASLRRRAEDLNGFCDIMSTPGAGTKVKISGRM